MSSIAEIKAHYNFTSGDADNLVKLRAVMQRRADEFVDRVLQPCKKHFTDADKFLKDEATVKKHQDALEAVVCRIVFRGLRRALLCGA